MGMFTKSRPFLGENNEMTTCSFCQKQITKPKKPKTCLNCKKDLCGSRYCGVMTIVEDKKIWVCQACISEKTAEYLEPKTQ